VLVVRCSIKIEFVLFLQGIYKACVETEDNVSADKNIDNCEDVEVVNEDESAVVSFLKESFILLTWCDLMALM